MTENANALRQSSSVRRYSLILAALWTVLIVALGAWAALNELATARELVRNEANAHFLKDQAFRLWGASHGGVYVPLSDRTPANPHLSHVPDRDIEVADKTLTLMNPAYMVRQLMEEYEELYGVKGRITSLKPLWPENAPDGWEREALESFERGETVADEFVEIDGEPFLRLIRPLTVKKSCLKCHEHQGYKEGDVRGGVGVSVPAQPFFAIAHAKIVEHSLTLGVLWLVGLTVTAFGNQRIERQIAERRRAQREREELIAKLELQNAELERFAYTVSHDLKSPLITIKGYIGMLSEDLAEGNGDSVRDDLARMSGAADKMGRLLADLLELSRIGRLANPSTHVPLAELADEALELLRGSIEQKGAQVDVMPGLPVVYGDRTRLLEVLQNLVDNAVKYSGDGCQSRIEIGSRRDGDDFVCYVRDNGIGIKVEHREKVFGIFHQLDPSAEGSGIGLALVKRIVEVHGGRIWVESEGEGHGSTFCFTIPSDPHFPELGKVD